MHGSQIPSADGFILVYSIASRASFDEIATLHAALLAHTKRDAVPVVVVGHKCDLEDLRQVSIRDPSYSLSSSCSFRLSSLSSPSSARISSANSVQITSSEGRLLAKHLNARFLEASAKSALNSGDAFANVVREIRRHRRELARQENEKEQLAANGRGIKGKGAMRGTNRWRWGTRYEVKTLESEIHPDPRDERCVGCVVA